jgi:DNA-binding winged helix-turn-helix (wHTH) protein
VRKLRRKLEKLSAGWEYIHTHFGVGYRFEPEAIAAAGAGNAELETAPAVEEPAEVDAEPAAVERATDA